MAPTRWASAHHLRTVATRRVPSSPISPPCASPAHRRCAIQPSARCGWAHNRSVIARYTRPEMAEIWSEDARFEAMRQVEVAACEEMDGPTPDELEAIRAATFTVEAIA